MNHTLKYLIINLLFAGFKETKDIPVPSISTFTLQKFQGRVVEMKDNQVTISWPFGVLLKNFTTEIETQNTVEIIPKSSVQQDFSKPIYYPMTGEKGTKVIYTVKVILEAQPMPIILSNEKYTTEAGLTNIINGKYFGGFAYGVKDRLINNQSESEKLPFKLLDSSKIEIFVPISTKVGIYKIKDKDITFEVVSPTTLQVSHKNMLSNDTLGVTGKYFDPNYTFSAVFKKMNPTIEKSIASSKYNQQGFMPKDLVGFYEVYISNTSEGKLSKLSTFSVNIFDQSKAFISKIFQLSSFSQLIKGPFSNF